MPHIAFHYFARLTASIIWGTAGMTLANAAETVALTLKDHTFTPAEVTVPANERFRIEVTNQDPTPAEFESSDLRVEKIVVPGGRITVMAGPLKPGTYGFVDDYNPDKAKGTVVATERQSGR